MTGEKKLTNFSESSRGTKKNITKEKKRRGVGFNPSFLNK